MDATARSSAGRSERPDSQESPAGSATGGGRPAAAVLGGLRRALALACTLVLYAAPALGHGGHAGHGGGGGTGAALPIAVIAGSVLVLGTSLYLDRVDELDGTWRDVGVLLGIVGLLAGLTLAVV